MKKYQKTNAVSSIETTENTVEMQEETNIENVETDKPKTLAEELADVFVEDVHTAEEPKKTDPQEQPSTLLVNKIYRLKKEIESKETALAKSRNTLLKWEKEDKEKLTALQDKFNSDKVKTIIQMNETGCLEAKKVMVEFYQNQVQKLEKEIAELEATGNTGEFSERYRDYLNEREARYTKQFQTLKKNFLDSSEEKRTVQIPKLEEQIEILREELAEAESSAEKYKKA